MKALLILGLSLGCLVLTAVIWLGADGDADISHLAGARGQASHVASSEPSSTLWRFTADELATRVRALGLAHTLPDPVPALSLVPPSDSASGSGHAGALPVGVRGVAAVAAAPRFDPDQAARLLLDPDLRLLATKSVPTWAAHVFVHYMGEWAAVVVETEEGWHMPIVAQRELFDGAFVQAMAMPARPAEPASGLRLDFDARRLLVLRALFEWQLTLEATAGAELVRQTGFPVGEIGRMFASPRFLSYIESLPDTVQWDVQMVMMNDLLLSVELAALQQQRLVQRRLFQGQLRYVLSPEGGRVARLLFSPVEQLRITTAPRLLNDTRPLLQTVNQLALNGPKSAFITFHPDGRVAYTEEPWLGAASFARLQRYLGY
jgi:hypothetical protein